MAFGKKRSRRIGLLLLAACMLAGCGGKEAGSAEAKQQDEERVQMAVQETETEGEQIREISYSLWNAYWNLEGVEEQTEILAEHVKNVNFFAAYFDQNDDVFIPQETTDFYTANGALYRERGWNCYLTVVNDQINADGSSSLKTTELLYRLLEQEERYTAHAESLITLAKEAGYDGLEIDYENIRKDDVLWGYFMNFIGYLYDRCEEENLLLRVVIETNINADQIDWVEGPTYCVMCYNLYGSHSEPGPKADRAFLEEIMEKMRYVPGEVDYALANGGFDWGEDGTVKSLTVKQAETLMAGYGQEAERDESAAKVFTYTDENGVSHEVWYGDQETLDSWMLWLQSGDNWNYSIWRLGD
ncbi:MAG: glycosyl hydrolase [Lachnospiraceae bacterium]|nr:glycosyl hydrolase [Lachnospiraceae bacterium]